MQRPMSKKKQVINQNYLENKPKRNSLLNYTTDEQGVVTLEVENTGVVNRVFQKLFRKPKITYVHLDEMGSFIWPYLDGEMNITELGVIVKEHFGEKAEPLYERLSQFVGILSSHGFCTFE